MTTGSPDRQRPVIGEEGVRHIAELARLSVASGEIPSLARHFERMLDFVEKLNEVVVEGVEPDLHPPQSAELLRADEPREPSTPGGPLPAGPILENAPDHDGTYFVTPKVV